MNSPDTQLEHEMATLLRAFPITRQELAEHLRSLLQETNGTPTEAQVQAYECLARYDGERPQ